MKTKQIKELVHMVKNELNFDSDEAREMVLSLRDGENDFEVGNYRFISEDAIDEIMQDELSSDEYVLGCFTDWFLADVLDIDIDVIQAMQSADAYEALGKLVISKGKLEELQRQYVIADGYGHHFNHYDFNEWEAGGYYAFRID